MKMIKFNENGRSMVEMLGVLAIIGVLSVGAIAGYSKAMFKYKMNKTVDEISNIVANIRTIAVGNVGEDGIQIGKNNEILKNLNIVPENMWQENKLINSFGGEIDIQIYSHVFNISYQGLSSQTCIELATQNWSDDSNFVVVGACGTVCDGGSVWDAAYLTQQSWNWVSEEEEAYTPYWEGAMSLDIAHLGCHCTSNTCEVLLGYKI